MAEDEMIGCHHQLNGHEFEQTLGNSEGQGIMVSHGVSKSCTRLGNRTTKTMRFIVNNFFER